jgi:transcription elongation factor GreA
MQRYPMTPEGKVALEKELQQLKTVDRPRITKRLLKHVSMVI